MSINWTSVNVPGFLMLDVSRTIAILFQRALLRKKFRRPVSCIRHGGTKTKCGIISLRNRKSNVEKGGNVQGYFLFCGNSYSLNYGNTRNVRKCHSSGGQQSIFHGGRTCSISGQTKQDFFRTDWHRERFFFSTWVSLITITPNLLYTHFLSPTSYKLSNLHCL